MENFLAYSYRVNCVPLNNKVSAHTTPTTKDMPRTSKCGLFGTRVFSDAMRPSQKDTGMAERGKMGKTKELMPTSD